MAADVTTTFAAKDQSFKKTIDGMEKRLRGFQGGVKGFTGKVGAMAGAFAKVAGPVAALGAAFLGARTASQAFFSAVSLGGELNDLAARTGAAAGELMVLQRAFQNSGAGAEKVGPTINKLQRSIVEAGQGVATYTRAFDMLNLSHEELSKMNPTEQLRAVAEAISQIPNPSERSAVAMQLLGRSGGELLPFLRNFSGELDNANAQLGSAPRLIDEMNVTLDTLGDNFGALKTKATEFALGALKNIAPALVSITDTIAKIDFAAMGEALSDALLRAFDFFRGLWANPMEIFSIYSEYMDAIHKTAGDALITGFRYAFDFFVNTWQSMIENGVFGKLADLLADAFFYGVAQFNLKLIEMFESVLKFWGQLFGLTVDEGTGHLTDKLASIILFFASDFARALLDPIGFFTGKLTSSLFESANETAGAYQFAWGNAAGNIIEKTKAGLRGAAEESGKRLEKSSADFGSALGASLTTAVEKTEVMKSNFFGSSEAIARVTASAGEIEASGRSMRENAEAASIAQGRVPTYAESMAAAYEAANLSAEGLRQNIAAARLDSEITGDIYTGPSGIANTLNSTADKTAQASSSITTAYDGVARSGQAVQQSMDLAGQSFTKAASDAGLMFGQEVRAALSGLTDSFRGFATETTLQQAVTELRTLVQRLPQPVLV